MDKLSIEIDEETAQGEYANLAIITHSSTEFVVDFIRVMPAGGSSKAKVRGTNRQYRKV